MNPHPHIGRAARPATLVGSALLGLAGWGLLLSAHRVVSAGSLSSSHPGLLGFSLFLIVIVASRAMATRLLPDAAVALDSGFYIAATVCLGSVLAGRTVAIALTLDSLGRVIRARRDGGGRSVSWPNAVSFVLYFGGMSGALLTLVAWWFRIDGAAIRSAGELQVLVTVAGSGAVFLLAHYTIQGLRLAWLGQKARVYLRRMAVPALLAEAGLLPLAAIIVFLWDPARPLKFVLLAATYLLMNYAFHRLSWTGTMLRQRVSELENLNVMAHRLASSLQTRELVDTVARETLAAIPEAEILSLHHHPDGHPELVVDWFERGRPGQRLRPQGGGLAAKVMAEGRSLYLSDIERDGSAASARGVADSGVRSWIGVPIEIYGAVAGALAVQSRTAHAFSSAQVRLLEAIAAQAAVALQNARLYELAMVDGLTGLFVRRYFDARLDEEIQRSKRFGSEFSAVMMDIDDFKHLNDTHGHQAGDRVLRAIGEIIRHQMRAVDTAARYGGEEFAMILPRTSMVDAYNQAERIRQQIADYRFTVEGQVLAVTASFGIASHPESKADSAEMLIRQADRAMYRAKRTGKNRVELYWADDATTLRSRIKTV